MKTQNSELTTQVAKHYPGKITASTRARAVRTAATKSKLGSSRFPLSVVVLLLGIGFAGMITPAAAGTLGNQALTQLVLPQPCPGSRCNLTIQPVTFFGAIEPTIDYPTNTPPDFTGTWSSQAGTPWQGTFTGTGPYPHGVIGQSVWDFTSLNATNLPTGTFLNFGDLDGGSFTDERFLLQAFDANHNPIQTPWLDGPSYCSNAPSTVACGQPYMPEYVWGGPNGSTGINNTAVPAWTYEFDGGSVAGNPTTTIWLNTNTPISYMVVDEFSTFDGMGLAAPTTPEPSSLLLMGTGVLGLGGFLRRRLLG